MAGSRVVAVEAARIVDWPSFHDAFAEAFGFPDWYGRNMDAWIDLFSAMDGASTTAAIAVQPGETMTILLQGGDGLKRRSPELYDAIVEGAAFVNWRRIEAGGTAYLCLAFR